MNKKIGIIRFPGSNCDRDMIDVLHDIYQVSSAIIDYRSTSIGSVAGVIVPGGFSYGDYLRAGALASHAPIMLELAQQAGKGLPVLGICNGFQILTEARLLPGTLLKNKTRQFICETVYLKVEKGSSLYHKSLGQACLNMPIAHGEGNYAIDDSGLKKLHDQGQILFKYASKSGVTSEEFNPNGSRANIAGITNKQGNVLGLMPHPERASYERLNTGVDGRVLLSSFLSLCAI